MPAGVVMVGSAFDVRGGVSAMARVCAAEGLFERAGASYLASHCDGGALRKLARAASAYLRFRAMLAGGRVSLLHVHLNSDASFWRKSFFVAAARRTGVPYILHVHCGNFGRFVAERAGRRGRALAERMLREAAAVIALSPQGRAELEAIAPGIAIDIIPNPVCYTGDRPGFAENSGETGSVPSVTVVFLGVVTEAKGAFDLVRAWGVVAQRHPGARLVVAGSGDIEHARGLVKRLGIADSVDFPGWVSGEAKDTLLRGATVFALPSHAEAMPMSVLEAMASGVPVVASAVGGVPWMLDEGRAGILVPPRSPGDLAAALDRMLSDRALRRELASIARARVEAEFAGPVVIPRIETLWARVGGCRRPDAGPADVPFFTACPTRTTPTPPR
jgi:glycosyltransferase involved in cell wall biosynthesis